MKYLFHTLIIFLTLCSPVNAYYYSGVIAGRVTDKHTNEAVDQAIITTESDRSAISYSNGTYWMMLVQPYTHTVFVHAIGYKMYSCVIEILPYETIFLDVQLEPEDMVLNSDHPKTLITDAIEIFQRLVHNDNHNHSEHKPGDIIKILIQLTASD